jgi:hypothetical protein
MPKQFHVLTRSFTEQDRSACLAAQRACAAASVDVRTRSSLLGLFSGIHSTAFTIRLRKTCPSRATLICTSGTGR